MVARGEQVQGCGELRALLEIPPAPSAQQPRQEEGGRGPRRPPGDQSSLNLNGDKPDWDTVRSRRHGGGQGAREASSGEHHFQNGGRGGGDGGGGRRGTARVPVPSSNGERDDDEISL